MTSSRRRRLGTVVLVLLLLASSAPVGTASLSTGPAEEPVRSVPESRLTNLSSTVAIWERAALPLRANTGPASTTVSNLDSFANVESQGTGDVPLDRQNLAVWDAGEEMTLQYQSKAGADTELRFGGEQAQLLVARLNQSAVTGSGLTTAEAVDLLADRDERENLSIDAVNRNATFELTGPHQIDSSGSLSVEYTPTQAGHYVFFLVQDVEGQGVEVDADTGNLSLSGRTQIIGVETASVQRTQSTASLASPPNKRAPGDTIRFDVNANTGGSDVDHVLLVYDHQTFSDQEMTYRVSGAVDEDLSADQITVEHSFEAVNGVSEVQGDPSVLGVDLTDGEFSGSTDGTSVVEFVAESAGGDPVGVTKATDSAVLDASVTAVSGAPSSTTIAVETFANWSEGQYRYVHLAVEDETVVSSDTGVFQLRQAPPATTTTTTTTTSRGGGGGGGGGGDNLPRFNVGRDGYGAFIQISKSGNGDVVDTEDAFGNALSGAGIVLTRMQLTTTYGVERALVKIHRPATERPSGTPAPPTSNALGYVRVDTVSLPNTELSEVVFEFRVEESAMPDGVAPRDLVLYRYDGSEWTTLPTQHLGDGRYRATAPGFSVFAVGVEEGPPQGAASFSLSGASIASRQVSPGEPVEVTATVTNDGNAAGTYTATLYVDGSPTQARTVRLDAGEQRTVTFEVVLEDEGRHELSVNEQSAGRVEVIGVPTSGAVTEGTETPGTGDDGSVPIWLYLTALALATAAVSLSVYNRYREA